MSGTGVRLTYAAQSKQTRSLWCSVISEPSFSLLYVNNWVYLTKLVSDKVCFQDSVKEL